MIDRWLISPLALVGEYSLFWADTIASMRRAVVHRFGMIIRQCESIGVSSLTVTAVAGCFLGAVLGYQLYMSFHLFGAEALLPSSVGISLFRELGPVMTAVMVTGRAGASMAAELASMRVSEQIDALEVMAVDPIEYLVAPRVIAGLLMMPLLAVFFCVIGSISAAVVACGIMGLPVAIYWNQYTHWLDPIELIHCTVKAGAFGLVLTSLGCYCGFRASGGARAVGLAARNTVVSSLLGILLCDYILTSLLPYGVSKLKVL